MVVRIIQGDCRQVLLDLPPESVDCIVTSPPYWQQRDYQLPPTIWGGDPDCDHQWSQRLRQHKGGSAGNGVMLAGGRAIVEAQDLVKDIDAGEFCANCGAWRGSLDLEPDYRFFVAHIVEIGRYLWRVLKRDGTLWLNLGDSYSAGGNGGQHNVRLPRFHGHKRRLGDMTGQRKYPPQGLKSKDLVGIPWRVAFALQDEGWILRQDIIWHKPNPMPESVTDRCTKAHEYLFLLAKSGRYYFDADAIAEPASVNTSKHRTKAGLIDYSRRKLAEHGERIKSNDSFSSAVSEVTETRNKRDVWTIGSEAFSEAHFATFPPALIEPAILAGCRPDGTVLDPFGGAGTVGLVADRLQRNAILIEMSPEYVEMAQRRIFSDAPLFAKVAAE
jgi:DNA modification methylase